MKVLQEGNPNGWEIERDCTCEGHGDGGCGAKLLVSEDDICVTTKTGYKDDTNYCYSFQCPKCNCFTDIPHDKIPMRVRGKAMHKYMAK